MKVKDLPPNQSLENIKVKAPGGFIGYWKGQWQKGVWLGATKGGAQIYPQFVDDIKEALEWEVIEDGNNNTATTGTPEN